MKFYVALNWVQDAYIACQLIFATFIERIIYTNEYKEVVLKFKII